MVHESILVIVGNIQLRDVKAPRLDFVGGIDRILFTSWDDFDYITIISKDLDDFKWSSVVWFELSLLACSSWFAFNNYKITCGVCIAAERCFWTTSNCQKSS